MVKKYLFPLALILILSLSFIPVRTVMAQSSSDYQYYKQGFEIIPKECLGKQDEAVDSTERCDLKSVVKLFVNLAHLGLKTIPYLAILMIIISGFYMIGSGGSSERVQQGKRMFSSVIIGVLIALFLSWGLAGFTVYLLTGDASGMLFTKYGKPWSQEWWGGVPDDQTTPDTGCCVITGVGCIREATESDCTARGGDYQKGITCENIPNPRVGGCAQFTTGGCCVATAPPVGPACYTASNIIGCTALQGYTYRKDTPCSSIDCRVLAP